MRSAVTSLPSGLIIDHERCFTKISGLPGRLSGNLDLK